MLINYIGSAEMATPVGMAELNQLYRLTTTRQIVGQTGGERWRQGAAEKPAAPGLEVDRLCHVHMGGNPKRKS